jgi:uncharacterized membrane protein
MEQVVEYLKAWQLHPFVDHFTVALIVIGVLVDVVAALVPSRLWFRHMGATLMVLGALGAFASRYTGGWEAERVWDSVSGPAKALLHRHAELGHYLPFVFGVLAIWRLGLQFVGALWRSRIIYLVAALIAGGLILYQGDLGSDLVYDYGVGTTLLSKQEAPSPEASPVMPTAPQPIPTVYVPPSSPAAVPTPAAPSAAPSSTSSSLATSPAAPEASPSAAPSSHSTTL